MPKSLDVELNTAPIAFAARNATTVSGRLGIQAATRSPGSTPTARSAPAVAATATRSCSHVSIRRWPSSRWNTIAGSLASGVPTRRFSARLRRASGKKRAPSMRAVSRIEGGAAGVADHLTGVPHRLPHLAELLHAPRVEGDRVGQVHAVTTGDEAPEPVHPRTGDTSGRGRPERSGGSVGHRRRRYGVSDDCGAPTTRAPCTSPAAARRFGFTRSQIAGDHHVLRVAQVGDLADLAAGRVVDPDLGADVAP